MKIDLLKDEVELLLELVRKEKSRAETQYEKAKNLYLRSYSSNDVAFEVMNIQDKIVRCCSGVRGKLLELNMNEVKNAD